MTLAVPTTDQLEGRVLVLAPTRRDADVTRRLLSDAGVAPFVCDDLDQVAAEAARGAAAVVLTDDAAEAGDPARLLDYLHAQPEWSELPIVMLVRGGAPGDVARFLSTVNGATLLERPVLMRTLVSTVQAALRARRRQYQVRGQLDEIRRLLASERDARAQAESANQAKDQFLAVLSHELRTPLTPVLATAQVMSDDPALADDVRDAFDMIRRNVELEARLIDDLLDLTRIVRGKLELQPVTVDVHAKVASVLAIVDSDIRAKRLSLVTALDARPHHVSADPARLQQVLWNLLKNALKFTPEGGTITLRTWTQGGRLRLSVTDTGVGIPADVLPRLFNAFEQGGREMTRLFGGLGLGLAISKALVEAHGGTIEVASGGAGRGATFTVDLPAVGVAGGDASSGPGDARRGARQVANCKILIVEDHPDTARAMARILAGRGYTVRTADTVASALSAVTSDAYDLIISDIGLPDGSGLDLMRQIIARNPIRGIALSGFGMEEDVRRSKAAGFHSHLTKPVNVDRLEAAVRQLTTHCADAAGVTSS